jgi:ferric enterobactin receptor
MKFKRIKKSGFTKSKIKLFLLFITFIIIFQLPFTGYSQNHQFKFDNTPISKALVEVAHQMNIRIAFDAGQLGEITITKTISKGSAKDIILSVLEETNYTISFKYDTYLVYQSEQNNTTQIKQEKNHQGIIFDTETGERLPYATLLVWDKNQSISTTVDGTFSAVLSDSASTFIQVKYLGYYTLDTIINTANSNQFLNLGLSRKIQTISTVEVMGENLEMIDMRDEAGHFAFNPARFSDLPNYGETDVFRALQLLPGISAMENSSQLNIRGSSADQNLVLFDGFTLYNLDHFFGVFSALNPNVIKNIQVYRGGFDSRYGERVSGIVDITGKSGNKNKPEFYGGINLISANLTAEIPVTEKLVLVAAGRRAYSDIYSSWLADALLADKIGKPRRFKGQNTNTIEPKFHFGDFNLKLTYNINQQENIAFSFYGAKDHLNSSNIVETDRSEFNTEDINEWGNYGFGAAWKKQWNTNYFSKIQLGHSGYFNDYFNNTILTNDSSEPLPFLGNNKNSNSVITNETNDLIDYFITFQNKYSLNPNHQFEFGLSTKFNKFTFYKDATRNFIYSNLENSSFLYSMFFQDKIIAKKRFTIKPGFRLNFYSKTQKINFEPRLTASYKTENDVIFKFATGRYFQYLNKSVTEQSYGYNRDFWVLADNDEHPVVSSNHFIAGVSYQTKNLFFDVEAYYKTVRGLQEYLFIQEPNWQQGESPNGETKTILSQFISGNGKAFGIDILAKYENTNFTSWLAYSISKATRTFSEINAGEEIPASYDQTHEIKWTNIYNYTKWNFSTLALYTTGHPYISYNEKDIDFNALRTYSRLPNYFRIDFSVNYNFNMKKVNIKPGMSILNVLNTENYLDIYTRNFDNGNNPYNETTLVKAQDLTLNFFVNFRF